MDGQTERCWTKWSLCAARRHKNMVAVYIWCQVSFYTGQPFSSFLNKEKSYVRHVKKGWINKTTLDFDCKNWVIFLFPQNHITHCLYLMTMFTNKDFYEWFQLYLFFNRFQNYLPIFGWLSVRISYKTNTGLFVNMSLSILRTQTERHKINRIYHNTPEGTRESHLVFMICNPRRGLLSQRCPKSWTQDGIPLSL